MNVPDLQALADARKLRESLVKALTDLQAMRLLCCALLLKLGGEVEITGAQAIAAGDMDVRFIPGQPAPAPDTPEVSARVALVMPAKTESFDTAERGN